MIKKGVILLLLAGILFCLGLAVGHYRIFPFHQLVAVKDYVEKAFGFSGTSRQIAIPASIEVQETFLQRLLVKKIHLPGFDTRGGGFSVSESYLVIVNSKGSVNAFDLNRAQPLACEVPNVPMNFVELNQSGHPAKNEFKVYWFRVNGVFFESRDDGSHYLFVSHNAYDSEQDCISQNVSRCRLQFGNNSVTSIGNWERIFTASPCIDPVPDRIYAAVPYPGHISGGVMINFDNERLLVGVGDYNRQGIEGTQEWAMDLSNPYGKLILLDKNTGDWSVYAYGMRNPSGIYQDNDEAIWSVELGPMGGDELNLVIEGDNYGWPKVSYGLWYETEFALPGGGEAGTHPTYRKPVFSWIPSISPRGLTKIEGKKFAAWDGDLLVGTMEDKSLHRLRLDDANRVIYNERIPIGHRIRDMTTFPDGNLALLTDDSYLIILDDGGAAFQEMAIEEMNRIVALDQFDALSTNFSEAEIRFHQNPPRALFERHCSSCHNLGNKNQIGPNLAGLLDRPIGKEEGFRYSQALKREVRRWDLQLLKLFLKDPQSVFPTTTMPRVNLSSEDLDQLLELFKNQSTQN